MKAFSRHSTQNIVVALFVITACLIVILRSLSPLLINSDSAIQIGTALSLLDGNGFGTYALNDDISQPPKVNSLTWFAPGFSIVLFLFIRVGLPLAIALKLMYAIATIVGWLGWGLIFRDVMQSQPRTIASNGVAVVLAVLLPFYFTYDWVGTDLFLWAGIPLIIRLFYFSQTQESEKQWYSWIGCLVGLMYTIRYAAIFIILAFFLFFLIKRKGFVKLGKIVLGFGIFYGAVSLYRALARTRVPSHLNLADFLQADILLSRLSEVTTALQQFKFLLFSHLSHYHVFANRSLMIVMILIYLSILIWGYPLSKEKKLRNPRIEIILCFNFALIIFLSTISFISSVNFIFLGDQRYYYPLFPSLILLAYEVGFKSIEKRYIRDYIVKFVSFVYLGTLVFSTASTFIRAPYRVFGFWEFNPPVDIAAYPSNEIRSRFPESHRAIVELLKQNPQTIAISFAHSFLSGHIADASIRQRMLPVASVANVNSSFLSTHTVRKDVQVYLIFGVEDNCKNYCYYKTSREVELMKQLPPPQLVYKNEKEKIRIVSSKLTKGLQFTFSSE